MTPFVWQTVAGDGLARCVVERTPDGHRITGTTLLVDAEGGAELRYSLLLDDAWRIRTVGAHVQSTGPDRRMALTADERGAWSSADVPLMELIGAYDVDLSWSPAGILATLRRLSEAGTDDAEIAVVRIAYPDTRVTRAVHRIAAAGPSRHRLETPDGTYSMTLDERGWLRDVQGLWVRAGSDGRIS